MPSKRSKKRKSTSSPSVASEDEADIFEDEDEEMVDAPEEDEVQPKKRGRGRPRKNSTTTDIHSSNDNNDNTISNSTVTISTPDTPKRGRGRPRKYPTTPKPPVDPNAPKRGRGRPRKRPIEELSDTEQPDTPKRRRGRPRKNESADSSEYKSKSDTKKPLSPILTRSSRRNQKSPKKNFSASKNLLLNRRINGATEESISDYENDVVYLSDSEEEREDEGNIFDKYSQPNLDYQIENIENFRGNNLSRKIRTFVKPELNKLSFNEQRIQFKDISTSDKLNYRYKKALQAHLPKGSVQFLRLFNDELLCPCCGYLFCHNYCRLRLPMIEVRSTLDWMNSIDWDPQQPFSLIHEENPQLLYSTSESERVDSLTSFTKSPFTPLDNVEATTIVGIVDKFLPWLSYFAQKLRVRQIHHIRFQRALHRFFNFKLNNLTYSDCRCIVKTCQILDLIQNSSIEVDDVWTQAKHIKSSSELSETPLKDEDSQKSAEATNDENGETKKPDESSQQTPHIDSSDVKQLVKFVYDLLNCFSTETITAPDAKLPEFPIDDEWNINESYIEFQGSTPTENDNKLTLIVPALSSRQSPAVLVKNLFKLLQKNLTHLLEVKEVLQKDADQRQLYVYSATTKPDNEEQVTVVCYANNWSPVGDIHLLFQISSAKPLEVADAIKADLKKYFKTVELLNQNSILLPHQRKEYPEPLSALSGVVGDIKLTTITGENPDISDKPLLPSTLIIGQLNDSPIVKCLLTWCNNDETYVDGPTIQWIAVHKNYRRNGIGSALISWIVSFTFKYFLYK